MRAASLVLAVLAAVGGGCGDDDGLGPDTAPITVGAACEQIGTAFCDRAVTACGLAGAYEQCRQDFRASCCSGAACDGTSRLNAGQVRSCRDAFASFPCADLGGRALPAACM